MFRVAKNKSLVIGLIIILAVFTGAYFYFRRYRLQSPSPLAENLPLTEEEEAMLEAQVGMEIPEGVEKAKLADVSGGEATGIATRKFEENKFEHSIIASLPDLESGKFYQGWLAKGEEVVPTGKLEDKKGGWVLNFTSAEDKSEFNQAMVTLEEEDDDQPEERILEGEF